MVAGGGGLTALPNSQRGFTWAGTELMTEIKPKPILVYL